MDPGAPLKSNLRTFEPFWCSLKIKEHFVFFKENKEHKEQLPSSGSKMIMK